MLKKALIRIIPVILMGIFFHVANASGEPMIDLSKARKIAIKEIVKQFGDASINSEYGFVFQDGASAIDSEVVFDLGRLYFLMTFNSSASPAPGAMAAYSIGLNGEDKVMIVSIDGDAVRPFMAAGQAVTKVSSGAEEISVMIKDIQKRYPNATLKFHDQIGILEFSGPDLVSIIRLLRESPLIEAVELPREVYPIPFEFAPLQRIRRQSPRVDLGNAELRPIWARLNEVFKTTGQRFATVPTVPKRVSRAR